MNLLEKNYNGINYLEFSPAKPSEKIPVIIYLHGAGERGDDLQKINVHGPIKEMMAGNVSSGFIVLAPQCAEGKTWWDYAERLYNFIVEYINQPFVDKSRVYLTGNSMGGYGTWALAMAHPELFAAILPICGGGMTWNAEVLKDMPIWAFHCVGDSIVPCHTTISMVDKIKKISQEDIRITIYPDNSHDAWTQTYKNPKIYDWLLEKRQG